MSIAMSLRDIVLIPEVSIPLSNGRHNPLQSFKHTCLCVGVANTDHVEGNIGLDKGAQLPQDRVMAMSMHFLGVCLCSGDNMR